MENFLDPQLRRLAMAEHERLWRRRGDLDRPKQSKSRHQGSDYVLTGLLRAKQDGEPLVGILCGRVGKKVRYYRHKRGNRAYIKGSIFSRMIPAKPIEDAVINVVAKVLMTDETLRDRIIGFIEAESQRIIPTEKIAELQKKRDQLRRRTELIVSTLDDETLADARSELDRLKSERRSLDEQIAAAEAAIQMQNIDAQAVADEILGQLRSMAANIADMPKFALRQLLGTVISRIEIDMETKAANIQMTLPLIEKNFIGDLGGLEAMRLVGTSASSTSYETHPDIRIKIGEFHCSEQRIVQRGFIETPCYDCRRAA
jgi:hypothetical protein